MKFKVNVSSIWEFGARKDAQGNPHQEDSLYPPYEKMSPDDRLFVVCDGMGGHAAGEVASATVVNSLERAINSKDEGNFSVKKFEQALSKAYDALDTIKCADARKPGTTLALLKLHSAGALIAHIGDSRVYHIRPGETGAQTRILAQTSDHSLVNELVKLGELTPEEARVSPQRNVITRAMQPGLSPRPKADIINVTDIRKGDYFYLCSDGMLEVMTDDELRQIFSREGGTLTDKTRRLTEETVENQDNHTAILVEIADVAGAAPARPATSMLTNEMSAQAKAVEEALSRQTKPATRPEMLDTMMVQPTRRERPAPVVERKRPNLIWLWMLLSAAVAAAIVWFICFKPSRAAEPAETAPEISEQQIDPQTPDQPVEMSAPQADYPDNIQHRPVETREPQPRQQPDDQKTTPQKPVKPAVREPNIGNNSASKPAEGKPKLPEPAPDQTPDPTPKQDLTP